MPDMSRPLVVDPGALRHRIDILQDQRSTGQVPVNATGEPQPAWSVVAHRWASIEAAGGREIWYGEQVVSDSTHLIRMRFFDGLTEQMRLGLGGVMQDGKYTGRVFEIESVNNPGEQHVTTIQLVQVKETTT